MRDGVAHLALRLPAGSRGRIFRRCSRPRPTSTSSTSVPAFPLFLWRETGPVEWYVGQGYAYVHADVRGSGRSEGEFGFMGLNEQQDYVELIAWIVAQAWCNGRVGGIGQSYYAMAQWLMATSTRRGSPVSRPTTASSTSTAARTITAASTAATVRSGTRRCGQQSAPSGRPRPAADAIRSRRRHHRAHARRRVLARALALLAARPDQVPVLSIGHWGKMGLHLRGNILGYEEVKAPKKLVVTGARTRSRRTSCSTRSNFMKKSCCRSTTSTSRARTTASWTRSR